MPIEIRCPCGQKLRTKSANAGRRILCPKCQTKHVVPSVETKPAVASRPAAGGNKPAAPSPKKPPAPPPRGEDDELFEEDDDGLVEAESASDDDIPVATPRRRVRRSAPEDEAPAKKNSGKSSKSKEKVKEPPAKTSYTVPLIAGGVVAGLVVLVLVGVFAVPPLLRAVSAPGKPKVKAPQEFVEFQAENFMFRCDVPKGWKVESNGGSGGVPPWVRIEHGRVKISFRSSPSGTLLGDISGAGQGDPEEIPDELKPVAKIHEYQHEKFSREMENFREEGKPEVIMTNGFGEGRLSTFTASGDFGSRIFAYRATLLENQWQWNVVCQCSSQKDFKANQELFRKVILSARH